MKKRVQAAEKLGQMQQLPMEHLLWRLYLVAEDEEETDLELSADEEDNRLPDKLHAYVLPLNDTSDPLCWYIILERPLVR